MLRAEVRGEPFVFTICLAARHRSPFLPQCNVLIYISHDPPKQNRRLQREEIIVDEVRRQCLAPTSSSAVEYTTGYVCTLFYPFRTHGFYYHKGIHHSQLPMPIPSTRNYVYKQWVAIAVPLNSGNADEFFIKPKMAL